MCDIILGDKDWQTWQVFKVLTERLETDRIGDCRCFKFLSVNLFLTPPEVFVPNKKTTQSSFQCTSFFITFQPVMLRAVHPVRSKISGRCKICVKSYHPVSLCCVMFFVHTSLQAHAHPTPTRPAICLLNHCYPFFFVSSCCLAFISCRPVLSLFIRMAI